MELTRRDFVRATSALLSALGLNASGVLRREAAGKEASDGGVPVVWLQGQACNGCSVSFLNAVFDSTVDDLLLNTLDVDFHPTIMAAAGHLAVSAAEKAYRHGGYVLVIEGAIPTAAQGKYCRLWPGLTMQKGLQRFAKRASLVLAVGACASFGGVVRGAPNPTGAQGVPDGVGGKVVVRLPSCPAHPDRIVATVAYILANGTIPELDEHGRPQAFYSTRIHDECPFRPRFDNDEFAGELSEFGCLFQLGCHGPESFVDCASRRWNPGGPGQQGINWCVGAGCPCYGCSEPDFPDGKSPFYNLDPHVVRPKPPEKK